MGRRISWPRPSTVSASTAGPVLASHPGRSVKQAQLRSGSWESSRTVADAPVAVTHMAVIIAIRGAQQGQSVILMLAVLLLGLWACGGVFRENTDPSGSALEVSWSLCLCESPATHGGAAALKPGLPAPLPAPLPFLCSLSLGSHRSRASHFLLFLV